MISMEEAYRQQQAGKVAADVCCEQVNAKVSGLGNDLKWQPSLTERLEKQARHQSEQSNQLFIALAFLKAHPEFEEFLQVQRILRDNGY